MTLFRCVHYNLVVSNFVARDVHLDIKTAKISANITILVFKVI